MKIATHKGIFHADEVTAIALLKVFTENTIEVSRLDHNTEDFSSFDMVVDIGKKLDNTKYFDHHQYKGGKSSAGLLWDYIGVQEDYHKISKLIKMVDDNDTGVTKAEPFEYSSLIKCYNHQDIHSQAQEKQFEKAVKFAQTIIISLKEAQEAMEEAKEIVANSFLFDHNPAILELPRFTSHWTSYINGELTPHIKAVVWEDEEESTYKVKIPPKRLGSFDLNGKPLPQDDSMKFVHSAGFFAIAPDEESMKRYLKKCL